MYFRNAAKRYVDIKERPNMPKYDSRNGNSTEDMANSGDNELAKEIELMKALYSELNALLQGFVEQTLDEYEYIDSPIYAENGIDRETLAQLVDRVKNNAMEVNDDLQEISLEAMDYDIYQRDNMLNSLVESLILTDIFAVRRPRYRRLKRNYVYESGIYDGVAAR